MKWTEVENLVVDSAKKYLGHPFKHDPRKFSQDFGRAYKQLKPSFGNPDYSLPLTGGAYALKYHLQRMDNMRLALQTIHRVCPLLRPQDSRILDVGSGTGATAAAIVYWLTQDLPQRTTAGSASITCVEPVLEMRNMAHLFLPRFFEQITSLRVSYELLDLNLQSCAAQYSYPDNTFDLIAFSYTFPAQNQSGWGTTTQAVLKFSELLRPHGVMLFLTPNIPTEKKEFMEHLALVLQQTGLRTHHLNLHGKSCRYSASKRLPDAEFDKIKHQQQPTDLLIKINSACFKKGVGYPLGKNFGEKGDRPYYSFPGTVQAFFRPPE